MATNEEELWHQRFASILQNPQSVSDTQKQQCYDMGIQIVRQIPTEEPEAREMVLQKLMILFPHHSELMYYMGFIWREHNFFKAVMWFQLCFSANPSNVENILDFTKLLFDNRYSNYIQYLNDTHQNILYASKEPRVLLLVGTLLIKERRILAAERVFAYILGLIKQGGNNTNISADFLTNIYLNISYICKQKIQLDKAMQYLHKSFGLSPHNRAVFQSLMITYDYQYHSPNERMELCKKYADMLYSPPEEQIFPPRPTVPGNRIRIGYVSSGFHRDVIAHFITPIIQHHNPTEFEVYLFTQLHYSEVTVKYRPWNGHVHVYDIQHLNDYDVAAFVYDQQIDILVDLHGYTDISRLGIFALQPAPVQITYLGFPNSLGVSSIQYRITDSVADNMHSTQIYSEQRLYMPRCFLLYSNEHLNIERTPRMKIVGEQVIFGALNREIKNSNSCMECWRKILVAVPNSKIIIKLCGVDTMDDKLQYYMDMLRIEDRDRLILIPYSDKDADYVRLFSRIDILLDTFPYSGTTTTCNALSASIPVVTLYNANYHAHNVSASILAHSGFSEFIAYTDVEYVTKAVGLARNPSMLQSYKSRIRDSFMKLMNPMEFMPGYENMLRQTVKASQWSEDSH
jgi:predicted O-linked N-acetylglucosamine transferase (SPINDLY family)